MDICNSFSKLKTLFEEEYCPLIIRYESISKEDKDIIINKYKKKKNIPIDKKVDIKDIINVKTILIKAFQYLKNYREFKYDLKYNLDEIKINNKKITTTINTTFKRKNKYYNKDINAFMTEEMENNIILEDNFQYFCDITYYALPPKPQKYKIIAILAFNNKLYKSVLCNLSLIVNENKEI